MDTNIMLTEQMAGQRLMLGFDGIQFNDELKHIIGDIRAGGIILFKRNIENPDQVARLCEACQDYAKSCGIPPLIISVDQEGGTVARLKEPFTVFAGNPFIKSVEDAKNFATITAKELKSAGINMDLAPVLDIAPVLDTKQDLDTEQGESQSIMKDRVFKGDAKTVSTLGTKVINTLQENGVMAVAKHFPGIGRTVKDSHFHLPVLDIDLETLEQSDIMPFKDAINCDVSGIMLSHIMYPRLDKKWQASLSPFIVNDLLREKLGYNGLIMTDDLDMKAIECDILTCIRQILIAGIDMPLICHQGPNIDIAFNEITRLLNEDENLYEMGKKSVERILAVKEKYLTIV